MSVRILDLYFDENLPPDVRADLVRYSWYSRAIPGVRSAPVWTMLVDLSQTPEEMLARMKSHTRYKIRRAEKDRLVYEHADGTDGTSIDVFADHFEKHASFKGLGKISRRRYQILAELGALDLSFIRDEAGAILTASSCLVVPGRVRGMHLGVAFRATSDHARRSMIGRANRYARWRDLLRFRERGVQWFDFGGWYAGTADAARVRINEWKAEFPGTVVQQFCGAQAFTLKGRLVSARDAWRAHDLSRRLRFGTIGHIGGDASDATAP